MAAFSPIVRELAQRLRRLELDSLVYFHADHFEPWRSVDGRIAAVGSQTVESVHEFLRDCERIDFARRLTLFYKPHLNYALRRDPGLTRAHPEDLVAFLPRTEAEERFGRAAMHSVAAMSRHEIQLHIHHEYYTSSTSHTDSVAVEWFRTALGKELDDRRLELAIKLIREIIKQETGLMPEEWFFVHGQWSLNASDESACNITNEIEVLMRSGCRGDFTFPAGRAHTDPRIKVPYFCAPVNARKAYDLAEAAPEIAWGNGAAHGRKFFIWSCPAPSLHCSIDYMSKSSRRHLDNTKVAAEALINGSYCEGRCLFVKTHAHSMHSDYFRYAKKPIFPHLYPATQTLLGVLFDAASYAGLEVKFSTASEVYRMVTTAAMRPEADLAATYLNDSVRSRLVLGKGGLKWLDAISSGFARKAPSPSRGLVQAPLERQKAIKLVRETASAVLTERIEKLGPRGSGAYQHYVTLLERGFPIPDYELKAFDIALQYAKSSMRIYEIGSGLGILVFMLALSGCSSVGIEKDRRRHATSHAIWHELAQRSKVDVGRCQLVLGAFPRAAKRADLVNAMAIVTDFITTQTPEQVTAIVDRLNRFRFVLLDLQRFCIKRETRAAQQELLRDLQSKGLTCKHEFPDPIGSEYSFVLFESELAKNRRSKSQELLDRVAI
jgi:hypothetical protein